MPQEKRISEEFKRDTTLSLKSKLLTNPLSKSLWCDRSSDLLLLSKVYQRNWKNVRRMNDRTPGKVFNEKDFGKGNRIITFEREWT